MHARTTEKQNTRMLEQQKQLNTVHARTLLSKGFVSIHLVKNKKLTSSFMLLIYGELGVHR